MCRGGGKGALVQIEKSGTLGTSNDQTIFCCMATQQGGAEIRYDDKAKTLIAAAGMSGNNYPVICLMDQGGSVMETLLDRTGTLRAQEHGHQPVVLTFPDGVAYALRAKSSLSQRGGQDTLVLQLAEAQKFGTGGNSTPLVLAVDEDGTILLNGQPCVGIKLLVRRLTPLECERLQGYPDGWTDIGSWTDSKGKLHKESSDSARYMALGNSIALPPWKWVMKRISAQYERDATMASLFDGIGGFPFLWEQINGKGSCLWASEIEEFPIAVTRYHFEEEQDAMTESKRRVAV